jgi:hypothetical protein
MTNVVGISLWGVNKFRMFEKKACSGPETERNRKWRRLHQEKLCDFSQTIVKNEEGYERIKMYEIWCSLSGEDADARLLGRNAAWTCKYQSFGNTVSVFRALNMDTFSPKRWYLLTSPRGVTIQKTRNNKKIQLEWRKQIHTFRWGHLIETSK